jgi:hypothetical protein
LSRAALPDEARELDDELQVFFVKRTKGPMTKLDRIREETTKDSAIQELISVVCGGWPNQKAEVTECVRPYWDFRDVISVYSGIAIKNSKLIIPASMRNEIMQDIHAGHMGIVKCLARARSTIFWPGMSSMIKQMVEKCP